MLHLSGEEEDKPEDELSQDEDQDEGDEQCQASHPRPARNHDVRWDKTPVRTIVHIDRELPRFLPRQNLAGRKSGG